VAGIGMAFGVMHMAAKLEALKPVSKSEDVPPQIVLGDAVGTIDGKEYTPIDCVVVDVHPFNVALRVISLVAVNVALVEDPLFEDKDPPLLDHA